MSATPKAAAPTEEAVYLWLIKEAELVWAWNNHRPRTCFGCNNTIDVGHTYAYTKITTVPPYLLCYHCALSILYGRGHHLTPNDPPPTFVMALQANRTRDTAKKRLPAADELALLHRLLRFFGVAAGNRPGTGWFKTADQLKSLFLDDKPTT